MAVTLTTSTLLELLALIFVAAVVLVVPAIALVLTVGRPATRRMPAHARIVTYRLMAAVIGIGLAALGIGLVIGRDPANSAFAALVIAVAVLIWRPLGRDMAGRGVLAWALTVVAAASFLGFGLVGTLTAQMSTLGLVGGLFLWLVEAVVVGIGLANLWHLVDVRTRRARPPAADPLLPAADTRRPLVSYVRHGSMLAAAAVVGAVVFLAPFTPKPELGDLRQNTEENASSPDGLTATADPETADRLSRVAIEASATPIQQPTPTDPTQASDPPRSDATPATSTHDAPGRPTEKPPPPGHTKTPPGHSDDHPKHQDHQDDQDDQEG
jgi:hypothetical protein